MCFYIIFYTTIHVRYHEVVVKLEKPLHAFLLRNMSHIFTCTHIKYMGNQQQLINK